MSETLKDRMSWPTFKFGTRIFYALMVLVAGLAFAAGPSDKSKCEIFLASGIPLSEGELPDEFESLILRSQDDVARYLVRETNYPWRADLAETTNATFTNGESLIYLSELGPTLWKSDQFEPWTKAIRNLNNDPRRARELLLKLAFNEAVSGLSAEATLRIHNSLLAREEELRTEDEARINSLLYWSQQHQSPEEQLELLRNLNHISHQPHGQRQVELFNKFAGADKKVEIPPDPVSGGKLDLSRVDPKFRDSIAALSFEGEGYRSGRRAGWEMREASPSLWIQWRTDFDQAMQMTDITQRSEIQVPGDLSEGMWVTRTILREALVRRKLAGAQLFGETLSEDEIFYLAAFPEFLPAWPHSAGWIDSIRNQDLDSSSEFYSSSLIIPINGNDEKVFLEVDRGRMQAPAFSEDLTTKIYVARYEGEDDFSPADQRAVAAWLQSEWQEFMQRYDLNLRSKLIVNKDDDLVSIKLKHPLASRLMIAFFAYLTEKNPLRK